MEKKGSVIGWLTFFFLNHTQRIQPTTGREVPAKLIGLLSASSIGSHTPLGLNPFLKSSPVLGTSQSNSK